MRQKIRLLVIILTLAALVVPLTSHASVVGRFSLVRGEVDVLKAGKIPAIPAKFQDGVEPGDIIRTKAKAKAQLTMVDDSVITLAPETRLAIADYQYNPVREERRAVLRAFRGLVHTVVNRIIKTEEPDFIMETHTATIGVRGTNWYTLLGPSSTLTALPYGILFVKPNVSGVQGILLRSMQFIQVPKPFLPQVLTPEILRMLEKMMDTGLTDGGLGVGLPTSGKGDQFKSPLNSANKPGPKALDANDSPDARADPSDCAAAPAAPAAAAAASATSASSASSASYSGSDPALGTHHWWLRRKVASGCIIDWEISDRGQPVAGWLHPAGRSPGARVRDAAIRKNLLALIGAKEYY